MPSLATLDPRLAPYAQYLVRVAEASGLKVQVTSVVRTRAQQQILYQRYLARLRAGDRNILPANPPGTSLHEHGLAFDLVVNGDWRGPGQRALGALWRSWGGKWAGDADPVHFYV
jgi:hypothetical protein